MFSSRVVHKLPDYRSDPPQVVYKERRGDFLIPDTSFTETFLLKKYVCLFPIISIGTERNSGKVNNYGRIISANCLRRWKLFIPKFKLHVNEKKNYS
jgi:hypothetical protein